jgi:formamidopyrimidine-DNA glycosylase
MPELPEVQTTVDGIQARAKGLRIKDVWTDYRSDFHIGKDNIANPKFFSYFKKAIRGAKILKASRRAKNVLIHLDNDQTIVIHMKMTGHVLYGHYKKEGKKWVAIGAGPLRDDPFNRHIHLVFSLSNGRHLALSDMRKFAKVTLVKTDELHISKHTGQSGPEPLDTSFDFPAFKARLFMRPQGKVKQVLMNHEIVAGIGNIYSDEILWRAGIHPLERIENIPQKKLRAAFKAMKDTLSHGIGLGGDSMSDYRNIDGLAGKFQDRHNAYQKTGERCEKKNCKGTIRRIVVGARSAHFCDRHQRLLK